MPVQSSFLMLEWHLVLSRHKINDALVHLLFFLSCTYVYTLIHRHISTHIYALLRFPILSFTWGLGKEWRSYSHVGHTF